MSDWIYLHYDAAGTVIYVGCTSELRRRNRVHRKSSPWRDRIARIEVDSFREHMAALRREMELIQIHRPEFNRRSNPDHMVPDVLLDARIAERVARERHATTTARGGVA